MHLSQESRAKLIMSSRDVLQMSTVNSKRYEISRLFVMAISLDTASSNPHTHVARFLARHCLPETMKAFYQFTKSELGLATLRKALDETADSDCLPVAKLLVDSGVPLKSSLLSSAFEQSSLDVFDYLISKNVPINWSDLIFYASRQSEIGMIRYLDKLASRLNFTFPVNLALSHCASNSNRKCLMYLLKGFRRINFGSERIDIRPAIRSAISSNSYLSLLILAKYSGDYSMIFVDIVKYGSISLFELIIRASRVEFLDEKLLKVAISTKQPMFLVYMIQEYREKFFSLTESKEMAIIRNDIISFCLLANAGATVSISDFKLAATHHAEDILLLFLSYNYRSQCLHSFAFRGKISHAPMDVDPDFDFGLPVRLAAMHGLKRIAEYLVPQSNFLNSAFEVALEHGKIGVFDIFIKYGAIARNEVISQCLVNAIHNADAHIVRKLLHLKLLDDYAPYFIESCRVGNHVVFQELKQAVFDHDHLIYKCMSWCYLDSRKLILHDLLEVSKKRIHLNLHLMKFLLWKAVGIKQASITSLLLEYGTPVDDLLHELLMNPFKNYDTIDFVTRVLGECGRETSAFQTYASFYSEQEFIRLAPMFKRCCVTDSQLFILSAKLNFVKYLNYVSSDNQTMPQECIGGVLTACAHQNWQYAKILIQLGCKSKISLDSFSVVGSNSTTGQLNEIFLAWAVHHRSVEGVNIAFEDLHANPLAFNNSLYIHVIQSDIIHIFKRFQLEMRRRNLFDIRSALLMAILHDSFDIIQYLSLLKHNDR